MILRCFCHFWTRSTKRPQFHSTACPRYHHKKRPTGLVGLFLLYCDECHNPALTIKSDLTPMRLLGLISLMTILKQSRLATWASHFTPWKSSLQSPNRLTWSLRKGTPNGCYLMSVGLRLTNPPDDLLSVSQVRCFEWMPSAKRVGLFSLLIFCIYLLATTVECSRLVWCNYSVT